LLAPESSRMSAFLRTASNGGAMTPQPLPPGPRPAAKIRLQQFSPLELVDDRPNALFDRLLVRAQRELRLLRGLVGRGNAGEVADLSFERLLVQTLRVSLLADLQITVHVDLQEAAFGQQLAHGVAVVAIRGHERADGQAALLEE